MKREQAKGIHPIAREIRYVEVDFAHDDLSERLEKVGYDQEKPTVWLWEAVTLYLWEENVRLTLSTIAQMSAPGSHVILTYLAKENGKVPGSLYLSLIGEPVRSAYTPSEMTKLAGEEGWGKVRDSGIEDWQSEFPITNPLTRRSVGMQWNERVLVGKK